MLIRKGGRQPATYPDRYLYLRVHNPYKEGRLPRLIDRRSCEGEPIDPDRVDVILEVASDLSKSKRAIQRHTVVDSCSKKETLINGFRVTGLCPFEPNNVDFSKCIARVNQPDDTPTSEKNVKHNMNVLTYSEFCNIVGESILEKCRTVSSILESDDNFFAIYNLWQRFEAASENNNNYRINNDVDRGPFDKPTKIVEDNYVTDIIEDDETPRSILDEFTGELINKNEEREDEKKEVYSEPTLQNNLIERSLTPQPSTSKQVTYSTVSIISNVSLTEYLKQNLPLSPKRQGKRQIERLPFALTSDQYVERIKAKQLKKD
ncbi:unnamed protein product [Parnassius apollo]|uniref:(apollo) hypothetical protein n=1 Tax=Parnassius apollo TaxID=110799 RepID=A0A8S3Y748_PARAO|nr:unnamed protein product [Parnassius apollo]